MRREIKFRTYNHITNEMEALKYIVFENETNEDTRDNIIKGMEHRILFYPMQYTGLKDKEGTEIYEGDIIDDEGWRAEIEFCEGKFVALNENDDGYLERLDLSDITYSCKVIGNIYQNKELLKWLKR